MKIGSGKSTFPKDLRNIILLWLAALIAVSLGVLLAMDMPLKMIPMVFVRLIFSPYIPAFLMLVVVLLLYSGWVIWWRGASGPKD
jgi:hypothetical protein